MLDTFSSISKWSTQFLNTIVDTNYASIFFFNELNLINFFNFKNICLNFDESNFNSFSGDVLYGLPRKLHLDSFDDNVAFSGLVLSDFFNLASDVFFLCFNFNNSTALDDLFCNFYLNEFFASNFCYKILTISIFKNQVITYSSWTLLALFSVSLYFVAIWFYLVFSNKVNKPFKNEKIFDWYNTAITYLVESEKEFGSLDDMFVGVSILICIYGWFFFGTIFFNFFFNLSVSYLYIGFPLFLFIVLGMPSTMIWDYGIMYPVYLRGSSNTTILILEFMYDLLATCIMGARLLVQNVRFILMFFAFFECYEFFFNSMFIVKSFYFFNADTTVIGVFYNLFLMTTHYIIFYLYNIVHLMYTVISHFFTYLILVFWFYSFLYTTFLEDKLENHFRFKR